MQGDFWLQKHDSVQLCLSADACYTASKTAAGATWGITVAATPALMPTNNISGPPASPSMIAYWIFQVCFISRPFTNEILRLTPGQQLDRACIEYHNDFIKKVQWDQATAAGCRREDVTAQKQEF